MHATGLTDLVGREEELDLLLRRWSRAKTGESQVVLLSGEYALPEWQQFKFTRNDPVARRLFGDYYIIDLRTHVPILGKDIEQLGRDLGVLKPWETLKS
jgi:hypothetical protein